MIALDTNVLVRFLVEDDEAQSGRAKKIIEKALSEEEQIFVPDLILVETAWVMKADVLGISDRYPRPSGTGASPSYS